MKLRYQTEREKRKQARQIRKKEEPKVAKQWDFNVRPGMSIWRDMPQEYKDAYYQHQATIQNNKQIAIEHAEAIQRATERQQRELQRKQDEEKAKRIEARFEHIRVKEREILEKLKSENTKIANINVRKKKDGSKNIKTQDAQVSNFVDEKFFIRRTQEVTRRMVVKNTRPKILLISDVKGWAWWNKSQYIKMYLHDDYDISLCCLIGPEASSKTANRKDFDLYLTYGYSYVYAIQHVPPRKRITGITAHRRLGMLQNYMRLANHCHANSLLLLDELKKMELGHKNLYYVPNGVDEKLFRPVEEIPDKRDTLLVGHVGKKCPEKGQIDIILPAINAVPKAESIYNMNDYRTRAPYSEMYNFYQDMDVFIVASVEDGTPNGALEAAACGRPIISNRIGNMPEFIKDGYNGFIVERKKEAYIEKLRYLADNRDHLIEMGKNARKTIEESWTWEKQAENYRDMFKMILGR